MRQSRSKSRVTLATFLRLLLAGTALSAPTPLRAQSVNTQGALSLLLPVGARAVGAGQAVVAEQLGSESVWWNPAALARLDKRELAIHHSQTIFATGDALSFILPSPKIGVMGLSLNIVNYGEQETTTTDQTATGTITPRDFVFAASYATTGGKHFNAGVNYKLILIRSDCSTLCGRIPKQPSGNTSAIDAGVQYSFGERVPLTLGASVRNLGLKLQVNDQAQADALPTVIQIGAVYSIPAAKRYSKDLEVRTAADLLKTRGSVGSQERLGFDAIYKKALHLRGGYAYEGGAGNQGGGPTVGLGLTYGSFVVDIARVFESLSTDAGVPPTYFSLRYLF